jgi:hypothetical protein
MMRAIKQKGDTGLVRDRKRFLMKKLLEKKHFAYSGQDGAFEVWSNCLDRFLLDDVGIFYYDGISRRGLCWDNMEIPDIKKGHLKFYIDGCSRKDVVNL